MPLRDSLLSSRAGYTLFRKVVRADRSMRTIVDEYVRPRARQTVLDLGCGTGDLARMLAADVTYIGVDHNPAYLNVDAMATTLGGATLRER
ncbi:MAG: methyltransferase domain-containing protein [Actinomycetes bacterium]